MANSTLDHPGDDSRIVAKRLDAAAWGAFFIWTGIAFLADVGWGIGLIGIGAIMLGGQIGRMRCKLPVERFWLIAGIVVVMAGIWEFLELDLGREPIPGGFIPILSIALGIAIIVSALLRKRH